MAIKDFWRRFESFERFVRQFLREACSFGGKRATRQFWRELHCFLEILIISRLSFLHSFWKSIMISRLSFPAASQLCMQPEALLSVHHHTALLIIRKSNSLARLLTAIIMPRFKRIMTEDQCGQGTQFVIVGSCEGCRPNQRVVRASNVH
jgi:hypothetical protein